MNYDSDFHSKLNKENKLLILCSRTNLNIEHKSKLVKLLQNVLDWEYILKFADIHRLTPLIYWNLKEFQLDIPPLVFNSLKDTFYNNGKKNLLMLGELFKLLNLFEKNGLKVIPYKGPLLSIQAYGDLTLRYFDDLDIYINKNDVIHAKEILISNGYIPQFNFKGFKERKFINSQREYKFKNISNDINVEIQWKFYGISFTLPQNIDFNVKIIEICNRKILSISYEEMLLILCIHASGHYWDRLSWLCDISELIQSHKINWDYVLEKSEQLGVKRLILVNLLLLKDILELELPNVIIKQLKSGNIKNLALKVEKRIFTPETNNIFRMADIRFNIREKRFDGMKDIMKVLFLPTNFEWEKYSLMLLFSPLSYCYRLFQVLRRYLII